MDCGTLIECKTYRYLPHTSDDDDKSYRSREEVEEAHHHDPIDAFATYLRDQGIADEAALEAMHDEVKTDIDRQITLAWEAPDPEPASALRHVFAEDA